MKRPIVVITVGYIIGIVWGLYCNCSIALLYAIMISGSFLYKLINKPNQKLKLFSLKRYIRYLKLIFSKSVIITIITSSIISNSIIINQNQKYETLYLNIKKVCLTGVVVSDVKIKENVKTYKIKIENIGGNTKFRNTYLLLNVPKNQKCNIEYGNRITVTGEYQEPKTQRNYKGFDYKQYLKTRKIFGTVKAEKVTVKNKKSLNAIFILANKASSKIIYNVKYAFPEENANLIISIMLGNTENLEENIKISFRDGNMAHVLAVSGIHISYIILGVNLILKKLSIGKINSRIITMVFLIVYLFITNFTLSAVRAIIMACLMIASKIVYRKNDIWNTMAISILIILLYNPFLVTSISVWLSYSGTIGVIVFNKKIDMAFKNIRIKNKRYRYKIKKRIDKAYKYIKEALTVCISIQIAIMPIICMCFNTINLSFIITNFLLSFFIEQIIIVGLIVIIISLISVKFLKIFSIVVNPLIKILILISKIGSNLPFNKIYVGTPKIIVIILYYFTIMFLYIFSHVYNCKNPTPFIYRIRNTISLYKYKFRQKKRKYISIILIISTIFSITYVKPKNLKIYFIDVGQGDSTLIVTPLNKKILIDGGGSLENSYDIGKNTLLPYLLDRGITNIDYIIISHFDSDHIRPVYLLYWKN